MPKATKKTDKSGNKSPSVSPQKVAKASAGTTKTVISHKRMKMQLHVRTVSRSVLHSRSRSKSALPLRGRKTPAKERKSQSKMPVSSAKRKSRKDRMESPVSDGEGTQSSRSLSLSSEEGEVSRSPSDASDFEDFDKELLKHGVKTTKRLHKSLTKIMEKKFQDMFNASWQQMRSDPGTSGETSTSRGEQTQFENSVEETTSPDLSGSKEGNSSFETDAEKQAVAELRKHFREGRALADPVRDAAALPNEGDSVYTDILHKMAREKGAGDIQSLCNISSFDSTVKEKEKRN